MVFNESFNKISAISWRSVLLCRNPEYPEKRSHHYNILSIYYSLKSITPVNIKKFYYLDVYGRLIYIYRAKLKRYVIYLYLFLTKTKRLCNHNKEVIMIILDISSVIVRVTMGTFCFFLFFLVELYKTITEG
jgi:hypothetical protein